MLSVEERLAIQDVVVLHGHLVDAGELDRLGEVFTEDAVLDVVALGGGTLHGWRAMAEAGIALGALNPVGHHVTNVLVLGGDGDGARVRSKGIGVMADGTAGSVVYDDELRRTESGWRIVHRTITPRREPLLP